MLALVDVATDDPNLLHLPRTQAGSHPQRLLLGLLGDYFLETSEPIPSSGLVSLLAEFGITSTGSRAALSRLSRRGLLTVTKSGRNTSYRLTPHAAVLLREDARRVMSFGEAGRQWSGTWTVVVFSVPEGRRRARPLLRARLRWLGFAPLYDGVWISPHPPTDDIDEVLGELEVTGSTVMVGKIMERAGGRSPLSAWDLDGLRGAYGDFIAEFSELRRRVASGDVGAAEGLVARTTVMDRWRQVPALDPELPAELLPNDWPRTAARALFLDVHDGLGMLAEMRVRQILRELAPQQAAIASHRSTTELTSG